MTTDVVTVSPEAEIPDVARLLVRHNVSAVPVLDRDGNLVGIVSESDLLRHPARGGKRSWWLTLIADRSREFVHDFGTRAGDVMTSSVITVTDDTGLHAIASLLEENGVKRVPVLRGGRLVGIVSRADVLRGIATCRQSKTDHARPSDYEVRDRVIDLVKRHTDASLQAVSVIAINGNIYLWGTVERRADKDAVRVAAENVVGASRVHDFLNVLSELFEGDGARK